MTSQAIGAEARNTETEIWTKEGEDSGAEVRANGIGRSTKNICPATANTNPVLIGIGSRVKRLRTCTLGCAPIGCTAKFLGNRSRRQDGVFCVIARSLKKAAAISGLRKIEIASVRSQ